MKASSRYCIAAASLSVALWQGRASACSVLMPEKQSLSCPVPGSPVPGSPASGSRVPGSSAPTDAGRPTSVAGARLELQTVEVRRSQYAPPGKGDCGELGHLRLRVRLAGSLEWPSDVGLLLTLREGDFPYFQPPITQLPSASGWLLLPQAGDVRFLGPDDPRRPLQVVLDARAVDCSNAVSAPIEVRISDPGRALDAGTPTVNDATPSPPATGDSAPTTDVQAARKSSSNGDCAFHPPIVSPTALGLSSLGLAALLVGLRRRVRRFA